MGHYTLNKYISRLVAVLLAVLLVVAAVPAALADGESGSCGDNLRWGLNAGTLTITGSGDMTDFRDMTEIPWYHLRDQIREVELPDGLTSIGMLAFYGCENIKIVTVPNSVKRISDYAFTGCTAMELLNLGNGVEYIGEAAFSDCYSLASLRFPGTLRTIGKKAFYRCESITTLTVPSSVTSIGVSTFAYCKSLVDADVQADIRVIPEWMFYGCNLLISVKLPDSTSGISEFAFRGCDQLSTVYYDGEYKTPEEIQQIVAEDVPGFEGTGNVTGGEAGDTVISGTATENPDGTVTQENTTVNQGESSTVSTTVTNTHPEDTLEGEISTEITVTVDTEAGWPEAEDALLEALKAVNETVTATRGTAGTVNITLYVKDTDTIDQAFLDSIAGRDVMMTVLTQDGSRWQVRGTDLTCQSGAESYDLRYEVMPGSVELCGELGTEKCYVLRFLAPAQINAEVMIRLDPASSLQNATLLQRDKELTKVQSSVVDHEGYAHFYLASVSEETEYYIAMNLPEAAQEAIIPEVVQTAYGSPEFLEPIQYEITGRRSSWGLNINQVTWILVGVMGSVVVIVGVTMFVLNKRKLKMGYVPDLDDEDE